MTSLTLDEKRRLMKADRIMSLNGMRRDQLLYLARILAGTLMDLVPDHMIESDWQYLYADIWQEGIEEIHEEP